MRTEEELTELENRYHVRKGGLAPIFYETGEAKEPYLAWYGSNGKPWPAQTERAILLCRKCDNEGLRDGSNRACEFETHLLKHHALSPRDYATRHDHDAFPVLWQP